MHCLATSSKPSSQFFHIWTFNKETQIHIIRILYGRAFRWFSKSFFIIEQKQNFCWIEPKCSLTKKNILNSIFEKKLLRWVKECKFWLTDRQADQIRKWLLKRFFKETKLFLVDFLDSFKIRPLETADNLCLKCLLISSKRFQFSS